MTKAALRKHYLAERKKLSEAEVEEASRAIASRFADWLGRQSSGRAIRNLHCFLPIHHHKEVNTYLIAEYLRQQLPGIQLIVSRIRPDTRSLEHIVWNDALQLVENGWGIPEPQTGEAFPSNQLDVVLVPLLIFDRAGHRVGYGKGFYDRFLAECADNTLKVGLSIFPPVEIITDAGIWDVPLNYCITPEKLWAFGSATI